MEASLLNAVMACFCDVIITSLRAFKITAEHSLCKPESLKSFFITSSVSKVCMLHLSD